jgi:hypothetical protein
MNEAPARALFLWGAKQTSFSPLILITKQPQYLIVLVKGVSFVSRSLAYACGACPERSRGARDDGGERGKRGLCGRRSRRRSPYLPPFASSCRAEHALACEVETSAHVRSCHDCCRYVFWRKWGILCIFAGNNKITRLC